jgi:hypothetical protein
VVGTGKESGKTTTCNFLIWGAFKGKKMGITSLGMGGSQVPLKIPEGSLVALAKNCLLAKKLELLEETDAHTPWGPIVIGKSRDNSHGLVAGPLSNFDLIQVRGRLFDLGCELVIIDGSLNRLSSTSSRICDSFALSISYANFTPESFQEDLAFLLERLSISRGGALPPSFDQPFLLCQGEWIPFKAPHVPSEFSSRIDSVFLPGPLTCEKIEALGVSREGYSILVEEPWMVFLSFKEWSTLKKSGIKIECCLSSSLSFISLNKSSFPQKFPNPREALVEFGGAFSSLQVLDISSDG